MSRKQQRARQRPIVPVFGESEHDRRAIKLLVEGLRPELAGLVEKRRQPLVLIKNTLPEKARSNAEKIFPEAVGKVVQGWREPSDWLGKDVGRVEDAKEQLAKAVQPRPLRKSPPRAYHERDSIAVAKNIVADGLLRSFEGGRRSTPHPSGSARHTRSASFEQFRIKVLAIATVDDPEG